MEILNVNINHYAAATGQPAVFEEILGLTVDIITIQEPYTIKNSIVQTIGK